MSNAVIYMKSNCKYYHEPTDVVEDADVHDVEPFTTCVTGDIQQLLEPPVSFSLMHDFERLLGPSANGYVRAEAMLTVIVENFPRMFRINKVVKMEVVE